jgi:hypothetical protein
MEFIRKWIEMPVIVLGLALLAIVLVVSLARGHIDLRDFISSILLATFTLKVIMNRCRRAKPPKDQTT